MDLFSKEELTELASMEAEPCVSIFMPTFHVESELSQNPIRLKNLIRTTREELHQAGYRESDIEDLLKPVAGLVESNSFWLDQSDGFAAFLTPEESRFFRLPVDLEELVVTGERFHLKPLFPLIAANNRFYILALSKNRVRLYQGTHHSISEVESTEIPESIMDVLYDEEEVRSIQHHVANVAGGRHDAMFHGRGVTSDDDDHRAHDKIVRFFRDIDQGVRDTLGDETAPLVLAGVEYYLPLYKEVNGYKDLVDDTIVQGNHDYAKPKELHQKAWRLVEPRFLKSQDESIARFEQLSNNGKGLGSVDIHEIVPGAVFGRVDTLFVEIDAHVWGRYDQESNTLDLHDNHEAGDEDLLDLAAVHTFMHGGTVHALRADNMPADNSLAATFRYPADVAAEEQ